MRHPQILYRENKEYQIRVPTKEEFDRLVDLVTLPDYQAGAIDARAFYALKNYKGKILLYKYQVNPIDL